MNAIWTVRLFGGVQVEKDSSLPCRFETRRGELLLARLALARAYGCTRDQLAETLWPDDFVDASRPRLRQEIARLKRGLGPAAEIVSADRLKVTLDWTKCETDVEMFRSALRRADRIEDRAAKIKALLAACAIQTGDLLPGSGADWLISEREELKRSLVDALLTVSSIRAVSGDAKGAADAARDATRRAPLDESAHARYLECLIEQGRMAEALAHYRVVERAFLTSVGVRPSTRLLDLVARVGPIEDRPSNLIRVRRKALPAALGSFIGREAELKNLGHLLRPDGPRLVSVSGPGGIGKTRLALESGRAVAEAFDRNVWFVRLTDVVTPARIGESIMSALGIEETGTDPIDAVANALPDARSLLILDNFEQLVDGGSLIVRRLLESCPNLHLVVTTRRRLNLGGEVEVPLGPLGVDGEASASADLFYDAIRAVRAIPDVPRERQMVAMIVSRLEGIPLAIHLAAARAAVLTLEEIHDQIESRFELLVSDRVDLEDRHKTLRRTIAWSYDMLRPELRVFFADLSVFRGGWTAALAEEALERFSLRDLLQELRDNSFVVEDPTDTVMRFRMLETLREFADERLESGRRSELRKRLASTMARIVREAESELIGARQIEWYRRLDSEIGNLRAALSWALDNDRALGVGMCSVLWRFWSVRGHQTEAAEWFDLFLDDEHLETRVGNWAAFGAARCAADQGDNDRAVPWFDVALRAAMSRDDPSLGAVVKFNMAGLRLGQGRYEQALALYRDSLETFRELNQRYSAALASDELAEALIGLGDLKGAKESMDRAHDFFEDCPDRVAAANHLISLAKWNVSAGKFDQARHEYEAALTIHASLNHAHGMGAALQGLADIALDVGELELAETLLIRASEARESVRDRVGLAEALFRRARVSSMRGDAESGARFAEDALAYFSKVGNDAMVAKCAEFVSAAGLPPVDQE